MGSKGLNGKTAAWCIFRKEVVILGEEMEQNTLRWEKPSLLRIILAIRVSFCKEEVGVTVFSVICLRHMKTAPAKSRGRSLPATVTMAWLRARRGSAPPVLHGRASARSWLVRAFCMEIGLSSQVLLPHVHLEHVVTLAMKPCVSGGLQDWIHKQPGGLWLYSYLFR